MRHHITIHPSHHHCQPPHRLNRREQSFVPTLQRDRSHAVYKKGSLESFWLGPRSSGDISGSEAAETAPPWGQGASGTVQEPSKGPFLFRHRFPQECICPQVEKLYPLLLLKGQVWCCSGQATLCDITKDYEPSPR